VHCERPGERSWQALSARGWRAHLHHASPSPSLSLSLSLSRTLYGQAQATLVAHFLRPILPLLFSLESHDVRGRQTAHSSTVAAKSCQRGPIGRRKQVPLVKWTKYAHYGQPYTHSAHFAYFAPPWPTNCLLINDHRGDEKADHYCYNGPPLLANLNLMASGATLEACWWLRANGQRRENKSMSEKEAEEERPFH